MFEFGILILVAFFATKSLDKAESVQLEEIDEIFGEGWWDNDKAEEWHRLTLEQTFHYQIDRQNTQIGQIEPNSTDQNRPLTEFDHSGQIEPNSNDLNPPLTESDHSKITPNKNIAEDERKRKIIDKFHAIKDEFKQKGKYSLKEWDKIDQKIAEHLKVNRRKIYEWKKEFGLNRKNPKNERKNLVEKFDQMKAELKRGGFKNSYSNQINNTVAKELGLSFMTIYRWKKELGQIRSIYSDDEKLKIVKKLMQLKSELSGKDKKSCKEIDKEIAERFGVNVRTINQWKKEFSLSQRKTKNERKNLVEKFYQMKAELKRDGFKNSYKGELAETVAKKLGITFKTIYKWKRELDQSTPKHKHSHSEQKELMKRYYEIKDKNLDEISDEDIAKKLNISRVTLYKWKKQFKRQQFHPNSVDGHSVEENAAALRTFHQMF